MTTGHWLLTVLMLGMALVGLILWALETLFPKKRIANLSLADNKQNKISIPVDFRKCDVIQTRESAGDPPQEQDISYLVYHGLFRGVEKKFTSSAIKMDRTTLLFYLSKKKTTFLYVGSSDSNDYFFDLNFLNET